VKSLLSLGAFAAFLGVALGAFGAHALKARLSADMLAVWKTAVEYQFNHALGLLAIGLLALHFPRARLLAWSGGLMAAGVLLFSGSLYALALTGAGWLGLVTPFGGASLLAAWGLLLAAVLGRALRPN
jgi:uncharacterized membrane protein YgdD (TMEM256/DUF423 family)